MSLTKTMTYGYGVAADYALLNLEIYLSKLKIPLSDLPLLDFVQSFTSAAGFSYDSAKTEFSGGKLQQINKTPAGAVFYASYTNNENGSWGDGTLTATYGGGVSVHDGYLDLNNASNAFVEYNVDNFASMTGNAGCIRKRIAFMYTGNAPYTQYIIQTSPGTANRVYLVHNAGFIQCYISNGVGTVIYSMTFAWTPNSGQIYEFEVNWNATKGYLFINGTKQSEASGSLTIAAPTLFRLGQSSNSLMKIYDLAVFNTLQHSADYTPSWTNFFETKFLADTVTLPEMQYTGTGTLQEITNFVTTESGAPRYTLQIGRSGNYLWWNGSNWAISSGAYAQANDAATFLAHVAALDIEGEIYGQFKIHFDAANTQSWIDELTVTVTGQQYESGTAQTNDGFNVSAISKFTESATIPAGDTLLYALYFNSKYWYFSGTWQESDLTPAKLNTAAQINSNLASLTFADNKTVYLYIYMASGDGSTTPELDENVFTYSFGGIKPTDPETCYVWGYIVGPDIVPVEGATVTVELNIKSNEYIEAASHMVGGVATATTDANGYWIIELIRSSEFEGAGEYVFSYKKGNTWERNKISGAKMTFDVPDADNVNAKELFTQAA